jgi:aerobic-type carbon monoxide dehydrogenase small subunit (CoxS/CutS family)
MEGVAAHDGVARAFMEHVAYQCGYCSPGFILSLKALLSENPAPSMTQLREALSGNLCRCGSYVKIIEAAASVLPSPPARGV